MSMIFGISLGNFESDNDEDDSTLIRSRRQFDLIKEVNACIDKCITTSYSYAVDQGIYTLKELRAACKQYCRKEGKSILANSKQKKQEEEEEGEVQDYDRPLQSVSSGKTDCEIKCLTDKETFPSLELSKKRKLCREKCANL